MLTLPPSSSDRYAKTKILMSQIYKLDLPIKVRTDLADAVCEALAEAHARGYDTADSFYRDLRETA